MNTRFLSVLSVTTALLAAPAMASVPDNFIFASSDYTINDPQLVINGTTTINATLAGRYDSVNGYDATNPNYIAGNLTVTLGSAATLFNFNDFFVFDLSGLSGPITSATLNLVNPASSLSAASSTYTNYDVSTALADLTASNNNPSIFNDLGSGTVYGKTTITNGNDVSVSLNAAALSALAGAEGSEFALGGTLTADVSAVPLPASLPMFLAAFAGLLGLGYAKNRRYAA